MKNTRILLIISLAFFAILISSAAKIQKAKAQDNISYPIPELGNCASQEECKIFCDEPANQIVCAEWAAKQGLMTPEELEMIRKQTESIERLEKGEIPEGPGGCKTPPECKHGLISPEEAAKIQKEMEESKGPGGCKTNDECQTFCSKPENMETCLEYFVKEGSLTPEEAEEIRQIMKKEEQMRQKQPEEFRPKPKQPINEQKAEEILKTQAGPGGCKTVEECKEYCSDISHAEECLSFAEAHSLVSPENIEEIKTMMKTGGPGGCRNPKECDEYCSLPEHQIECLEFAKKHNLISPEEAEIMEKMAGGGPGGCRNQQECDAYCSNPEHMQECLMFSVKSGMMSEEEAQRMIEIMKRQEERGLKMKDAPPTNQMGPSFPGMFDQGMPKQDEWPERNIEEDNFQPPFFPEQEFENSHEMMPPEGFEEPLPQGPPDFWGESPQDFQGKLPEGFNEMMFPQNQRPPEGMMPPQDQMPPEWQMPPEGFENQPPQETMPPEYQRPPQEHLEEMPPSEESPQSLLQSVKTFFANITSFLNFNINLRGFPNK